MTYNVFGGTLNPTLLLLLFDYRLRKLNDDDDYLKQILLPYTTSTYWVVINDSQCMSLMNTAEALAHITHHIVLIG